MSNLNDIMEVLQYSYHRLVGTGYMHVLWLIAIVYLLFSVNRKRLMTKIGWPVLIILFLIINPVTAYFIWMMSGDEGYFRTGWCLMMEVIIALAIVDLIITVKSKVLKGLIAVVAIAMICVCGRFIFTSSDYIITNPYKLMNENMEVADYLVENHPDEVIYAEADANVELRQYDARVHLLVGRYEANLVDVYLEDPNWEAIITNLCEETPELTVIVLRINEDWRNKMEVLGWRVEHSTAAYDIYVKAGE